MNGITVTYFYSACVGINTADTSVLCDPWFTQGAYDGSWYHYPPVWLKKDPLDSIGEYEYIYVSHIHPDHYDPLFLKSYLRKYPHSTVIIGDFQPNFLSKKMTADGVPHRRASELRVGNTSLRIFLSDVNDPGDIDSALAIKKEGKERTHSVVNMNDNLYNERQVSEILVWLGTKPDLALLGYTGAGPYPQTYYDDGVVLAKLAEQKKAQFFQRYLKMRDVLGATRNIPFAGKYILGGKLAKLNEYRGVADAVELLAVDPRAIILDDGGQGFINTETFTPSKIRTKPYDQKAIDEYVGNDLSGKLLDYEKYFSSVPKEILISAIAKLLPKAYRNAHSRSRVNIDWWICLRLEKEWFICNTNKSQSSCSFEQQVTGRTNRLEIHADIRLLFGLITQLFHWNNAEVGSLYPARRIPDKFDRNVQAFMYFFHV